MPNGPLSLPARLYLLAWDAARTEAAARLPRLVRTGALVELARLGLLTDEDGVVTPAGPDARTGDAVLDGLLDRIRASRPHRWRTWVTLRARVTLDAVREHLVAEGYVRAVRKRVLGVFPSVEYVLAREDVVAALREEARLVLRGPVPVEDVPEREAALVVLAAAARLRTVLPPGERALHRERLERLTERGGAAAPALRAVVRELRTAVVEGVAAASR
ncbi:GPP34 family phosphoprotein [Streptomyces sp. NPDC085946]|uniref:GOLPH3/VPS74 family protein n=1 Tax=Streptomyces sp. NPDC085946 TaxID=3365744 RepID=UPI0037CF9ECC